VEYGPGAARFAGATYDPTSHYRAASVFAFHADQVLTPERLRAISRHQIGLLTSAFESLDLDPVLARIEPIPEGRRAGFLAIRCSDASGVAVALKSRGVNVDARGDFLRLGPAPYLSDEQLLESVRRLGDTQIGRGQRAT
jgi:kynureninase